MDKKQFFESLVSLLPDKSGHFLNSLQKIQEIFTTLRSEISDIKLRNEFERLEKEILFHVWMLEQICNSRKEDEENQEVIFGPVIVISVLGKIIFANRAYCSLSGLSPLEIQSHEEAGTLYDTVYDGLDVDSANTAVSRLHAGKGYRHLELLMKHSGRTVSWNSYGGVGQFLEIRSGREISSENNQKSEQERLYRGNVMNTARLIENMYQVCIHGHLSEENEQKLIWIQEFLSMLGFLWNHSEFFMETIDVPTTNQEKIHGLYNTLYAQFFRYTFRDQKKFKDVLPIAHGLPISTFLDKIKINPLSSIKKCLFYQKNKSPVAEVQWLYSTYPVEIQPGYQKIFGLGILVRKIHKNNIFVQIYQYLSKRG